MCVLRFMKCRLTYYLHCAYSTAHLVWLFIIYIFFLSLIQSCFASCLWSPTEHLLWPILWLSDANSLRFCQACILMVYCIHLLCFFLCFLVKYVTVIPQTLQAAPINMFIGSNVVLLTVMNLQRITWRIVQSCTLLDPLFKHRLQAQWAAVFSKKKKKSSNKLTVCYQHSNKHQTDTFSE